MVDALAEVGERVFGGAIAAGADAPDDADEQCKDAEDGQRDLPVDFRQLERGEIDRVLRAGGVVGRGLYI